MSKSITLADPLTGEQLVGTRDDHHVIFAGQPLRHLQRAPASAPSRPDRGRDGGARSPTFRGRRRAAGGAAHPSMRTQLRYRDDEAEARATAPASRTTVASWMAARSGAAAPYTLLDYFPEGLPADRRRERTRPCRRCAAMYNGDKVAQRHPDGTTGSACPSAADNRPLRNGMSSAERIGQCRLRLRHARRPTRRSTVRADRGADHPAHRPGRPRRLSFKPDQRADRRPDRGDQRKRVAQRASACWSPPSPRRWPRT